MTANEVPRCIGIVLDGNRRWAKARGLSQLEGHAKGAENFENIALAVKRAGVKHLVVYAFSTENWERSPEEVTYLMDIFLKLARGRLERLMKEGVKLRVVGERGRLSSELREALEKAEGESKNGSCTLWICLSYGGRAEIVEAARAMQKSGEEITEESFAQHLWTVGMPDPDLIIRTGGAERLSNFLPWQSAYSELFFIKKFWPDFSEADLGHILQEYGERERRMGK
jgi:undecaprenyl diphosphate synthase